MGTARYVLKRVGWTVLASYLVLTAAFLLFVFTPNPTEQATVRFFGLQQALETYQGPELTATLFDRYVEWLVSYATLDLGTTRGGTPVESVIADTAPITLTYLVPGLVLGNLLGVAFGHFSGMIRGRLDDFVSTLSYTGISVPAFFIGEFSIAVFISQLSWYQTYYNPKFGLWSPENLVSLTLPAAVVTVNVLAVQARYTRAQTLEFGTADFVKTFRANGAGFLDRSRHVLRNAALPLVSLFFTEALTVLFITAIVVELVFRVPGLGDLTYNAIVGQDLALIFATTMIPVFVGLFGNLLQDVLYAVLDPRVDSGN
jgi:peptide/nickel transport system permease protein